MLSGPSPDLSRATTLKRTPRNQVTRRHSIRDQERKVSVQGPRTRQARQMLFRQTLAVRGYRLQYKDNIRLDVDGPHAFVVVLRHEPGEGQAYGEVILEITGEF